MPLSDFENKYKMVQRLGEGGFGTVYKVKKRSSGTFYAAKVVEAVSRYIHCPRTGEKLPEEIYILKGLKHDNILKYVEHFHGDGVWVIVMEYLSGYEDLYEYMRRKDKNFDELRAASIISQTLSTVNYLRRLNIDHRDIKLENILYNNRTKKIKVIDFGCASRISSRPYRSVQGTELYYPPEWFEKREFSYTGGTVWSIGMMTYMLLNGKTPFPSLSQEDFSPRNFGKIKWRNRNISSLGKKFIKKCLRYKSYERYSMDEMCKAKWLRLSEFA